MRLILYSKPGCHLCEGLQEKLAEIQRSQLLDLEIEIRDITQQDEWFNAYQYEIPVLYKVEEDRQQRLPAFSPRGNVRQLQQLLQKFA